MSQTRFWIPVLSLVAYISSCLLLRVVFPTTKIWYLKLGLTLAMVGMCLIVAFLASYTVCDPLVRLVRDVQLDNMVIMANSNVVGLAAAAHQHALMTVLPPHNEFLYSHVQHETGVVTPDLMLLPLSQVPSMGVGWLSESIPDFFQCAALTPYALEGRLMVGLALVNINAAFLLTTTIAHYYYRGTVHASSFAIIMQCFLFVTLIEGITATVINNAIWDWRVLYLTLCSAVASSYLAASVVNLPPTPMASYTATSNDNKANGGEKTSSTQLLPKTKPPPSQPAGPPAGTMMPAGTIARATWITIQPVLAVEYFIEQLEQEDTPPDMMLTSVLVPHHQQDATAPDFYPHPQQQSGGPLYHA